MNLPTLYELADEYLIACERLADTLLPVEAVLDTLEGLQGPIQEKATNVGMAIANLDAVSQAKREAAKRLLFQADRIDHRAEYLKNYLKEQMERTRINKIDNPYLSLSIKRNPPKVIVDAASQIPDSYWVQAPPPPPQLDKKHVADDIKAGKEVPGAHLEQSTRLEIK